MVRLNITEDFSNKDRDQIKVDNFEIQRTDGRNETTLFVKGQGWLTLEEIEKRCNK